MSAEVGGLREAVAEVVSWARGEMTRWSDTAHPDHNRWSWRGDGHVKDSGVRMECYLIADALLAPTGPIAEALREAEARGRGEAPVPAGVCGDRVRGEDGETTHCGLLADHEGWHNDGRGCMWIEEDDHA